MNSNTCLILLDPHRKIFDQLGDAAAPVIAAMVTALEAARRAGLSIMYVVPHFRPGYPGLSPRQSFVREAGLFQEPNNSDGLPDAFARRPEEPIISKFVYSPFYATDLELLLRRGGFTDLVLGGVSTAGAVFSTLRDAHDRDFNITIMADACADFDPEIHNLCVTKIFPAQATLTNARDWAASL